MSAKRSDAVFCVRSRLASACGNDGNVALGSRFVDIAREGSRFLLSMLLPGVVVHQHT